MSENHNINPKLATPTLLELENEGDLHFTKPESCIPVSTKKFVFSLHALWYWIIIGLSIAATISVFTINDGTNSLSYLRNALGLPFILFLPGFAFIKAIFPITVPIKTHSKNLDNIELIGLGFALSIVIVPMLDLALYYGHLVTGLTPITLSLLGFTFIFSTMALLREYRNQSNQTIEQ